MRVLWVTASPLSSHPWRVAPARPSVAGRSPARDLPFKADRKRAVSPTSARAHAAGRFLDLVAGGSAVFEVLVGHSGASARFLRHSGAGRNPVSGKHCRRGAGPRLAPG